MNKKRIYFLELKNRTKKIIRNKIMLPNIIRSQVDKKKNFGENTKV